MTDLLQAIAAGEVYQHVTYPLRRPSGRTLYRRGTATITAQIRPLEEAGLLHIPTRQGSEKVTVGLSDKGRQALADRREGVTA